MMLFSREYMLLSKPWAEKIIHKFVQENHTYSNQDRTPKYSLISRNDSV